jgi:hypothetical protein
VRLSGLLAAALGALAVALATPSHAAVSAPPPVDLAAHPNALQTVPMPYRPKFRWWWPSAHLDSAELDRELEAIKNAGFGGVEETLLRNLNQWWDPAFRESVREALTKATELGMRFDTTLGPSWPMSSQAVDDFSKGLSMQEIVESSIELAGPSTYAGPVPDVDENGARNHKLVAVVAAQPADQADAGAPVPAEPVEGPNAPPVVLDPKTAVDLTAQVQAGVLNWNVPSGRWFLVGIWSRATGQRAHGDAYGIIAGSATPSVPADTPDAGSLQSPLVLDEFSRAATTATLDDYTRTLFGGDMADLYRRNGGDVFEDSLELTHGGAGGTAIINAVNTAQFWTPSLLGEFRKRRGYHLERYLPVLFSAFDFPNGGGQRVRHDFNETLQDLLIDNHYKPIAEWAGSAGLHSRAQGYNQPGTDKFGLSSGIEKPDEESLDSGDTGAAVAPGSPTADAVIDDYRQVSSAAHLTGARELSLEAGADISNEYGMTAADYKAIADRAFAGGITSMIFHGFAYKNFQDAYQPWAWPGWSAFNILFAQSWDENFPELPLWGPLAGYVSRVSAALRNGTPRADITVLSDPVAGPTYGTALGGEHVYGTPDTAAALDASPYSWDRIDDEVLPSLPDPRGGRILPDGPGYRAIVVDGMTAVSPATARRLLALAKAGLPVVVKGKAPAAGVSFGDPSAEDAQVKEALRSLLALSDVRQVKTGKDVVGALAALGVDPDMRTSLPLVAQHRVTRGGDVWFLYNNSAKAASGEVTLASTGAPARIDPSTGADTALGEYRLGKGTVTLPLTLGAGDTMLLSFRRGAARRLHATSADGDVVDTGRALVVRDTSGGRHRLALSNRATRVVELPDLPQPLALVGPWGLDVKTVGPDGDGTVSLKLAKLDDWRDIPQLSSAAGTGTYTATIELPAGWLATGRGVLLDLGAVGGRFTVQVNGADVKFGNPPDGSRDITGLLHPGSNALRVVVATPILNEVIGRAHSGDTRYAGFATRTTIPLGLIGPVKLVPFAQATAATLPAPCASRRGLAIHLRAPRGFRPRSATLRIGKRSRRARVRRAGRRLRVTASLRGLPKGRVRVRVIVRGRGGRTVRTTRTYRLCTRRGAR